MKTAAYLFIGTFFGIIMYKSEAASWFRIYEMFRFDSFHMYGIIGSALVLGIIGVQFIKKGNLRSFFGVPIKIASKERGFKKYFFGGTIFGLGWALAGACPGPIYTLIGAGYVSVLLVLAGALLGAFLFGLLKKKLPH
ncbi:MAG: DUF6691 family protein [Salinimicrobium sp.]